MKDRKQAEIIIVGSGAGGATLAKELSEQKRRVIVVEKGARVGKIGTVKAAFSFYDKHGLLKSEEGITLYRTIMVGGTTVVSCGNGVRCLQEELSGLGINLKKEFTEAERELNVAPLNKERIIGGSRKIMEAAQKMGYRMEPMPKFSELRKCTSCGNCVLGCIFNAKWTAIDYLDQAIANGSSLITQTEITEVLISDGKAKGVKGIGPNGPIEIMGDIIVIAAGGLATPIILQKSGVAGAGKKLFCDLFNITYGAVENIGQIREITMAVVDKEFYKSKGFILSPFIDNLISFILATGGRFLFGRLPWKKNLGIMTKIRDESKGKVTIDGKIEKSVTVRDRKKLEEGAAMSREILIKAGAKPKSIFTTRPRGAHPGGTAAIGEVVNTNLETEVKNLFVCDASVLPIAPGLPPILTIVALAKWLSKRLLS